VALKEGPYPVRKCPSVNQKFQAEFGVAKEEPNDPWVGLGTGPAGTPLPSPVPYPCGFRMGVSLEQEKPPQTRGLLAQKIV